MNSIDSTEQVPSRLPLVSGVILPIIVLLLVSCGPVGAPLTATPPPNRTSAPSPNVVGVPSLSVPCGFDSDGMPLGLMLTGRPFDEGTLMRVAHVYQQSARWHERRPTL